MTRSIVADAKTAASFVGGICARVARIVAVICRLASAPSASAAPKPSPSVTSPAPTMSLVIPKT